MKKLDQNSIQSLIKLLKGGQLFKVESLGKELLKKHPDELFLHKILSTSLIKQNKIDEAIISYKKVLAIDPNNTEALNNLATIFASTGKINDAIINYKKVIKSNPDHIEALGNLGFLLKSIGKTKDASKYYLKAFSINQNDIRYVINSALLIPPIIESPKSINTYRNKYAEGLLFLKKYKLNIQETGKIVLPQTFFLSYQAKDNLKIIKDTINLYRQVMPNINYISNNSISKNKRIKIAFISQFLTMHTIGKLFGGLIKNLNKTKFEIVIFHTIETKRSKMKNDIDKNADKVINLKSSIEEQQNQIDQEKLDIIFYPDIGMSPITYFLAFSRFAPIQIVSWGHPETTGMETIDYFLSSTLLENNVSKKNYSERLIQLKTFPIFYEPPKEITSIKNRLDLNLPINANLYGCPQSLFKFHTDFDAILAKILKKDTNGYIVLIGGDGIIKYWIETLKRRWAKTFPIINKKTIFVNRLNFEEFISFCGCVDVLLDPIHFGGGNSFLEAMLVGTPTITKPGRYLKENITAAAYKQMKIKNPPIVKNYEDYINLSVKLANNKKENIKLRKNSIIAAKKNLFKNYDALKKFEKFLEKAYFEAKSGKKLKDGYIVEDLL